jgi:uncharacterized membrane protein
MFRWLAVLSHALLTTVLLWRARSLAEALVAMPLLAPLPGLVRGRDYTMKWASMLVVFYAAGYLAVGHAEPAQRGALYTIASLAAVDFVSLVLTVRLRARERQALAAARHAAAAATD